MSNENNSNLVNPPLWISITLTAGIVFFGLALFGEINSSLCWFVGSIFALIIWKMNDLTKHNIPLRYMYTYIGILSVLCFVLSLFFPDIAYVFLLIVVSLVFSLFQAKFLKIKQPLNYKNQFVIVAFTILSAIFFMLKNPSIINTDDLGESTKKYLLTDINLFSCPDGFSEHSMPAKTIPYMQYEKLCTKNEHLLVFGADDRKIIKEVQHRIIKPNLLCSVENLSEIYKINIDEIIESSTFGMLGFTHISELGMFEKNNQNGKLYKIYFCTHNSKHVFFQGWIVGNK